MASYCLVCVNLICAVTMIFHNRIDHILGQVGDYPTDDKITFVLSLNEYGTRTTSLFIDHVTLELKNHRYMRY